MEASPVRAGSSHIPYAFQQIICYQVTSHWRLAQGLDLQFLIDEKQPQFSPGFDGRLMESCQGDDFAFGECDRFHNPFSPRCPGFEA
ncbi:MAG: hypothetical protein OIF57_06790 [Marinobacterium sp.]|nr:hypothetical protein [Marinobacterium sp.]